MISVSGPMQAVASPTRAMRPSAMAMAMAMFSWNSAVQTLTSVPPRMTVSAGWRPWATAALGDGSEGLGDFPERAFTKMIVHGEIPF